MIIDQIVGNLKGETQFPAFQVNINPESTTNLGWKAGKIETKKAWDKVANFRLYSMVVLNGEEIYLKESPLVGD